MGSTASNIGKHFIQDPKVKGLVGVSPKWEEAGSVKQGSESPMNHLVKKYVGSSLLCSLGRLPYIHISIYLPVDCVGCCRQVAVVEWERQALCLQDSEGKIQTNSQMNGQTNSQI